VTPLRRTRLFDEVTDHLRELILSGAIPAGTQLLQIDLATQLGVSRTPLREAFRILEREGLIRVSNGNKTVEVVSLADQDAVEIYELREVLEGLAAGLAARAGLTPAMERRLRADADEMDRAIDAMELARYSKAHTDFHLGFVEASGNRRLVTVGPLIRLSSQIVLSQRARMERDGDGRTLDHLLKQAGADHRLILEHVVARDVEAAETAARRHAVHTKERIEELASRDASGAEAVVDVVAVD
jgi:DNA-binding GntR family transcriptional regulator